MQSHLITSTQYIKVAFFSDNAIHFLNLQIFKSPKKNKKIPNLEYFFREIWRYEKHIALSEKKSPLREGKSLLS